MLAQLTISLLLVTVKASAQCQAPSPTTTETPTPTVTTVPTLEAGWSFVRAVADPYFHSYLQTEPTEAPGAAYLASNTNAGQFDIRNGQLVYNTHGDGNLYMNVEDIPDKTQRKLQTWFNETENPYGTFAIQGDTITWSVSDIDRPNNAAWYVCEADRLYINTGPYLYQTPEGCSDQTVSYSASTIIVCF